jgi:hypothetical protein
VVVVAHRLFIWEGQRNDDDAASELVFSRFVQQASSFTKSFPEILQIEELKMLSGEPGVQHMDADAVLRSKEEAREVEVDQVTLNNARALWKRHVDQTRKAVVCPPAGSQALVLPGPCSCKRGAPAARQTRSR